MRRKERVRVQVSSLVLELINMPPKPRRCRIQVTLEVLVPAEESPAARIDGVPIDVLEVVAQVGERVEHVLELVLGDLLAQLAGAGQGDEAVLNIGRALLLDEADAAQSVLGLGVQDLVQDGLARFFLPGTRSRLMRLAQD